MSNKTKDKQIKELKEQVDFLSKVLNNAPASIHILEINEDLELVPFWVNEKYNKLFGLELAKRKELGFVDEEHFFNMEDAKDIPDGLKYLLEHPEDELSMVCRLNNHFHINWIYFRSSIIKLVEDKNHMLVIMFPIDDEMVFNQLKLDVYLKEINRLKNQLTISKLSKTELKVIELLGQGSSTKEVANNLCRSFDTINNHRRSIFKKLEIHKISELVRFAKENGLA